MNKTIYVGAAKLAFQSVSLDNILIPMYKWAPTTTTSLWTKDNWFSHYKSSIIWGWQKVQDSCPISHITVQVEIFLRMPKLVAWLFCESVSWWWSERRESWSRNYHSSPVIICLLVPLNSYTPTQVQNKIWYRQVYVFQTSIGRGCPEMTLLWPY